MELLNRRKYIRFHVEEASPLAKIKIHAPSEIIEARLFDISLGGMAFISNLEFKALSTTIAFLPFPDCECHNECGTITVKGQIRWSRTVDGTKLMMSGLEFLEESREENKDALLKLLACFCPKEQ